MGTNLIRTMRVASCLSLVAFTLGSAWAASSTTTGSLLVGRYAHSATLLADGRVLVAGGVGTDGTILAEAEIYDPATGIWTQTGSMAAPRFNHELRLMEDGKVIVTGGNRQVSSEVFDPATGKWSGTGSENDGLGSKLSLPAGRRLRSRTTSLQSGDVLLTGGLSQNNEALTDIAIFNPVANAWAKAGDMIEGRHFHTATELRDGRVLVAGGVNSGALPSAELLALTPVSNGSSSISSNFNGTPIAGSDFIWFNSVLKPRGLGSSPVTFRVQNSSIQFTSENTAFNLAVPNATITFSPRITTATASFDTSTNTWSISAPSSGLAGNTFLDGLIFQVPAGGLPGGVKPVTWQSNFSTDTPGVTLQWQWAASVHPAADFSADYNVLGVKPVDDNKASIYQNSDHAGTPEYFKCQNCLPGGATGGGGSNFTGSYSGTASVTPGTGVPATLEMRTENGTDLIWTAVTPGPAGNNLTLQFIWNVVPNNPLSVAVVGGVNIQVTLGTGPVGNLISTGSDIATLVNSTPATSALVTVTVVDGTFPESAFGPQDFSGGQ
jgi:hypothetical protein